MADTDNLGLLRSVFDALPSLAFVVDPDMRIQEYNAAAGRLLAGDRSLVLRRRAGDVLHCLHSREAPAGCGGAPACRDCVIRKSAGESFQGRRVVRRRVRMELIEGGSKQ
jgi:PAS domain-containing protein